MTWSSAFKKQPAQRPQPTFFKPNIPQHNVDWSRLVSLDFETYYADDYTLSKLSTSEYVRDPRFKAQMLGIKVGNGKTRIIPPGRIRAELTKINWSTHAVLCHNTQFDGFILSHHYGVHPTFLYDTLSMARGLHSNDIGAGLDEVSVFYGGQGKLEGLEATKNVLDWPKALFAATSTYCANDVDEMLRVFKLMLPKMPTDEIEIIDLTCRMFCSPVLKVDIPRVEKELARELDKREKLMYAAADPKQYDLDGKLYDKKLHAKLLRGPDERALTDVPRDMQIIKRIIGSNETFAELLRDEGVEPPVKISPAWMKKSKDEREEHIADKYAFAFAKDDAAFIELPNQIDVWGFDLNDVKQVPLMVAKQERLQALVDVRIAVKSTTNITRAQRFLMAGANCWSLPCGYAYYRAHTGRMGGQNKMNLQNLTRGGELRQSILAPKGHVVAVQDSGQIEARVNGWLWGQNDLMDAFRGADAGTGVDAYCNFAEAVYGYPVTKDPTTKTERFVGKVCVLGLGYQMGAAKLQITFAKGALGGPPIYFELDKCKAIVNTYRNKNHKIVQGWDICKGIIEDMAAGRVGSYGPLNWEKETIWLPNGMSLKYPDLRKSMGDKGWEEWSYQSKDMRKKIYGGLLCLGAKTEVLTDNGWKSIISVRLDDKLWDGTNWVSHSGLVHQGVKETVNFGGVEMTPDHEVLVNECWYQAQKTTHYEATSSFERHYRAPDRHADSSRPDRQRRPQNSVDSTLCLQANENYLGVRLSQREYEELRVLDDSVYFRVEDDAWHVEASRLCGVERDVGQVQSTYASVLGALRRTRNNSVSAVERIRDVLGRYAARVRAWSGIRPARQFARVQPNELSLGDTPSEHSEYKSTGAYRDTSRDDAALAGCRGVWDQDDDVALPAFPSLASSSYVRPAGRQKQDVFDLVDAGPLRRFTVRGDDGRPFIVHNCENIVQALARIIVMTQMLWISKKYRVVMTTHDETVTIAKTAQGQRCVDFMAKCMSTPLPWCLDLPLNCEGGYANNYSK